MLTPCYFLRMFSICLMVLGAGMVFGQDYPTRPIRIVTFLPGGSADFVARLIADGISAPLGQPVVVENRPTVVSAGIVAQAAPDGHTLYVASGGFWMAPFLYDKLPWDPVKDLSPITLALMAPNILVVHPSVPIKSVKDLIALAKTRPGELNYASGGIGSSSHLAAELLKSMTGINIVHIPYKGAGLAVNNLIGGQVQLGFPSSTSASPHVKSGRLKALAVTSDQPSALAPGLPTVAASGVPGYEAVSMTGTFTPAKTSKAIINRLNQEIVRVLNRADVKEKFFNTGAEISTGSPEQFGVTIKSEMARMGKVIKDAGIKIN